MKKLRATLELEMSVPEDWELVNTSEGTWASTDEDEALNEILDMVDSEVVNYEFVTH